MKLWHYVLAASIIAAAKIGYSAYSKEAWPNRTAAAHLISQYPGVSQSVNPDKLERICTLHEGTIAETYIFRHDGPIRNVNKDPSFWIIAYIETGYRATLIPRDQIMCM